MGISPRAMIRKRHAGARAYEAGKGGRLGSWGMTSLSADAELRGSLRVLRSKSRHLAENNDYFKHFLRLLKIHVVGPQGIRLQSKAVDAAGKPSRQDRRKIQGAWKRFNKKGVFDVTGKLSGRDASKLYVETLAKDGEVLVHLVEGFDNDFGFAVRFLQADHLDERLNGKAPNGNQIRLGVEYDKLDRPVAYWLFRDHPGDMGLSGYSITQKYQRIPAEEIIHEYLVESPRQGRGVPTAHTACQRMESLDKFEEAALVNARTAASKMGFYIHRSGVVEPGEGEFLGDFEDEEGDFIDEVEPGVLQQLPAGWDFKEWNPQFPNGDLDPFIKALIRGTASGLGVSYHSLANDLEGVSFSSIRQGTLEARDVWRDLQGFVIESFLDRVFSVWLRNALIRDRVEGLQIWEIERLLAALWRARGWDWVDPLKDQMANERALKARTKSFTKVLAEQGEDLEEHLETLQEEERLFDSYGLDLKTILEGGAKNASKQPAT
ncbi:phage portal protein [Desulfuromonas sp. TF]|uniref:phage portal protein n=1 Tax=Desulfuromonas sp. TF TaxID=1232410 RepID=UPI000400B2F0|nr:phage portal protein [Desulfuromonas sp. TF]